MYSNLTQQNMSDTYQSHPELSSQLFVYRILTEYQINYDHNIFSEVQPSDRQEAQLMLTNPRDAFKGESKSPNIVPFDMLGMVSCECSIVTLSLRRTDF